MLQLWTTIEQPDKCRLSITKCLKRNHKANSLIQSSAIVKVVCFCGVPNAAVTVALVSAQ